MNISLLFDCNNIHIFAKHVIAILPYTGVSMSKFYMCEANGVRFLTKLSFYRKTPPELYDSNKETSSIPPVDAELKIMRKLNNHIIKKNVSPCILELVAFRICTNLMKMISDEKCNEVYKDNFENSIVNTICSYKEMVKNDLAHDKCAFLVLEKCDISLEDFIKYMIGYPSQIELFRSIIFQIIYTLRSIQIIYPDFRHNDLHSENIMLKFDQSYKYDHNNPKYILYISQDGEFYVPYFGIIPKIIDFGFSSLPEENIISNITQDKQQMYWRSDNDLIILFYWIHNALSGNDVDIYSEATDILNKLEPNGLYIDYNIDIIRKFNNKIPTYLEMLNNEVFANYKITKPEDKLYRIYNGEN